VASKSGSQYLPQIKLIFSTYGADFRRFSEVKPLPNCVYAAHDYSAYGFPNPPEMFKGTAEQKAYHEKNYARKSEYMREINVSSFFNGCYERWR
jgi:hypothetical protein